MEVPALATLGSESKWEWGGSSREILGAYRQVDRE